MTHPSLVPPTAGRLGMVAYVTPTVYAVLDKRLDIGPELLGPHVLLGDDLAINPLDLLGAVIELESAFTICVPEREIDHLRTVADLVHVIAKYVWERDHPEPYRPPLHVAA